MSVVSPEPRAASVTPLPAVIGRRVAEWLGRDDRGIRFAVALAAGLFAEAFAGLSALPPPALAFTPFVSFAAGVLLGPAGILGAAVGQTLAGWVFLDHPWLPLVAALASAAQGLCGFLVFRQVPGLGRGLLNLRSYLWFCGAVVLGSLISGVPAVRMAPDGIAAPQVWTGVARSLISVLVLAPPVLILADRFARRWMVRLPREVFVLSAAPSLSRLAGARGEETMILDPPKPRRSPVPGLLKGGALVLGVSVLAVPLASLFPRGGGWTLLLYLIPILWAALRFGLRGGMLASSASGACFLFGLAVMIQGAGARNPGALLVSDYAELLVLILVGVIVGAFSQEQTRLRDELLDYNRLLRRDLLRVAEALTGAIEAKDAYTEGHLRRVSEYAVAVGEKLGLRGSDLERLHYASMLHDIGKLGVPEQVLRKEGPLNPEETEIMRRHPEIG
ncbi:MAG TPA: HD domain-containing phosphohydrolase, partial [Thermoanaerobaculia bacterium]|nr:HD domain-containing phosphohydrolase [Thermoanaerobaculia bacterium]